MKPGLAPGLSVALWLSLHLLAAIQGRKRLSRHIRSDAYRCRVSVRIRLRPLDAVGSARGGNQDRLVIDADECGIGRFCAVLRADTSMIVVAAPAAVTKLV